MKKQQTDRRRSALRLERYTERRLTPERLTLVTGRGNSDPGANDSCTTEPP
jgi:hypothetical protein